MAPSVRKLRKSGEKKSPAENKTDPENVASDLTLRRSSARRQVTATTVRRKSWKRSPQFAMFGL